MFSKLIDRPVIPRIAAVLVGCTLLGSCNQHHMDVDLLASDVHISIGGKPISLPFVAIDDFAYHLSYSLDRAGDRKRELAKRNAFLRATKDSNHPLPIDKISIVVRTYGWNDIEPRPAHQICPKLTRQWSRSVCENPWAALQQALPRNRITLIDLRNLDGFWKTTGQNCSRSIDENGPPILKIGARPVLCKAAGSNRSYKAVIRIDGDLGAMWTVSDAPQETAEKMATREGKAIAAFASYGVGTAENFSVLHQRACSLRRPGSQDGPEGSECR
ncbi:MAG TPA: hypothetical protein VF418_08525 [Sphingomonadaceae bacterium]